MCIENCGSLELSRCRHDLDGNINAGTSINELAAAKSNFVWSRSGRKFMGATVTMAALASLLAPGATAPVAAYPPDHPGSIESKEANDKPEETKPDEPSGYDEREREERAAAAAKATSTYSNGGPTRPVEETKENPTPANNSDSDPDSNGNKRTAAQELEFQNSIPQVEIFEVVPSFPLEPTETVITGPAIKPVPAPTPVTPTPSETSTPATKPAEIKPAQEEKTVEERAEEIYQQMRRDDPNPYYSDTPLQGKNSTIQTGDGSGIRTRNPDYWNKRGQLERAALEQAKAEQAAASSTPATPAPSSIGDGDTQASDDDLVTTSTDEVLRDGSAMQINTDQAELPDRSPIDNLEVTWVESSNTPTETLTEWQREQLRQEASGGLMLPGIPVNTDGLGVYDTTLEQSVGGLVTPSGDIEWARNPERLIDTEPFGESTPVEVELGDNKLVGDDAQFTKNGSDGKTLQANIGGDGHQINQFELPSVDNDGVSADGVSADGVSADGVSVDGAPAATSSSSNIEYPIPFGGGVTNADGSSTVANADGTLTTTRTQPEKIWGFQNGRAMIQTGPFEITKATTTDSDGNPLFTVIQSSDPNQEPETIYHSDVSRETTGPVNEIDTDRNQEATDPSEDVPWGVNPREGQVVEVRASYKTPGGSDLGLDLDASVDADLGGNNEADFGGSNPPGDIGDNPLDIYVGYEIGNEQATPSTVATRSETVSDDFGGPDDTETIPEEAIAILGGSQEDEDFESDAVAELEAAELAVGAQASVGADNDDNNVSGPCVDTDGDGWGWNGASCAISENAMAQQARLNEAASGQCIDTDGDGWGWNGASCKM